MPKKLEDFSMDEIMRLAQSPAGQQLMSMLNQGDPTQLREAVNQAQAGDYAQASKVLSAMLSSPEAKKLLKQLGGN